MAELRSSTQKQAEATFPKPNNSAAKLKAALDNNQLISLKEGSIRKKVGVIGLIMTIVCIISFPSFREYYGPLSMVFAAFIGVYRTGSCVVNLKWNIDGRGISKPPAEYLEHVANKRTEFMWLGITTFASIIAATIAVVYYRENAIAPEVLRSVMLWNIGGFIGGAGVSFLA